jgi:hypothetical protein
MHQVSEKFVPKTLDWWSETRTIFCLWKSPPKTKWRKCFETCRYRWRDVNLWFRRWNRTISILGGVPLRQVPKQHNGCALQWKQCCLFFFYHWGVWDYKYAPEGQTVDQDFYLAVLRRLREASSSMTTMRLLTRRHQLDNSWQNIQFLLFHNPTIHLPSASRLFSSAKLKITIKWKRFRAVEIRLIRRMTSKRY